MTGIATVTVDTAKIRENTRRIVEALRGVEVVGVTKVTCGSPEIGRAMLDGGAVALGESRLENAARLRDAGITAPIWMLRATVPALAYEVVALAEVSLESELAALEALDYAADAAGRDHGVIAMVDVGDLREGVMPADLGRFIEEAAKLEHLDIRGIGTSLTCYGAIEPSARNLGELVGLAADAARMLGRDMPVSGGSSTSIAAVLGGVAPAGVTGLRVGEAIVLGVDPATREPIPGLDLHRDAVTLEAPVIECLVKPSRPVGTCAQDAFGNVPDFADRGLRRRAILALGRQDAPPQGLRPLDPGVEVLGASSDHLIVDVDGMEHPPAVGETLSFVPDYAATLALFTSPYVVKRFA